MPTSRCLTMRWRPNLLLGQSVECVRIRETTLYVFDRRRDRTALRRVGRLLRGLALETARASGNESATRGAPPESHTLAARTRRASECRGVPNSPVPLFLDTPSLAKDRLSAQGFVPGGSFDTVARCRSFAFRIPHCSATSSCRRFNSAPGRGSASPPRERLRGCRPPLRR
jgi:hypothetical protein